MPISYIILISFIFLIFGLYAMFIHYDTMKSMASNPDYIKPSHGNAFIAFAFVATFGFTWLMGSEASHQRYYDGVRDASTGKVTMLQDSTVSVMDYEIFVTDDDITLLKRQVNR